MLIVAHQSSTILLCSYQNSKTTFCHGNGDAAGLKFCQNSAKTTPTSNYLSSYMMRSQIQYKKSQGYVVSNGKEPLNLAISRSRFPKFLEMLQPDTK